MMERVRPERVRIDKWLWAARFFKTRALASRACELGRIECNAHVVKASREIKTGDMVKVVNDGGIFEVEVLVPSNLRGSAPVAQTFYRETDASREQRARRIEERKTVPHFMDDFGDGKLSKRNRREFERLRGRF